MELNHPCVIDVDKVKKLLESEKVQAYIEACKNWDDSIKCHIKQEADLLVCGLKPIEIAVLTLFKGKEVDTIYPAIRHSEDFMFECFWVLDAIGDCKELKENRWSEADIAEYQQQWREAGIEPTLISKDDT